MTTRKAKKTAVIREPTAKQSANDLDVANSITSKPQKLTREQLAELAITRYNAKHGGILL